jgi:proline iminopeptidase
LDWVILANPKIPWEGIMALRDFYPEIEPFHSGYFQVSDIHSIYFEESGNPHGKPVVFLHGGPGAGCGSIHRRFFDPAFYRIVLFDQRGAGKSTPYASLEENTTWDLVEDIEKIRKNLGIDRWIVFGGSWGSTLALSYAITYPAQVIGLILRGIFLCRKSEIDWFYQGGASNIFPDAWEKYLAPIPVEERNNLVQNYYNRLTSPTESVQLEAAIAWSVWEASTSKLYTDIDAIEKYEDPHTALAFARIEAHYFIHSAFMPSDSYLLECASRIKHIPCRIIQGRYDMVCPITTAWDLNRVMPSIDLRIIPDAGHSAMEPGIASQLIQATDDFKILYP